MSISRTASFSFTLVLAFLFFSAFSTVDNDGISPAEDLRYKQDATRMALRHLAINDDYANINAKAPEQLVKSLNGALLAVHFSSIKEAKTVTRQHRLHTFPIPVIDRMTVVYTKESEWAVPMRLGDLSTDSEQINDLLSTYNLDLIFHQEWDDLHNSFQLQSNDGVNMAKVAKELEKVAGVKTVHCLSPNGDGNDITAERNGDAWILNYSVKFDDCMNGCKSIHTWSFEVSAEGNVTFLNENGADLPEWMK